MKKTHILLLLLYLFTPLTVHSAERNSTLIEEFRNLLTIARDSEALADATNESFRKSIAIDAYYEIEWTNDVLGLLVIASRSDIETYEKSCANVYIVLHNKKSLLEMHKKNAKTSNMEGVAMQMLKAIKSIRKIQSSIIDETRKHMDVSLKEALGI